MAPATAQVGYALLIDTLCYGVIPAEWDEHDRVILYDSHAAADAERLDWIQVREDAAPTRDQNEVDDGTFVERVIISPDGSLTVPSLGLTLSRAELSRAIR